MTSSQWRTSMKILGSCSKLWRTIVFEEVTALESMCNMISRFFIFQQKFILDIPPTVHINPPKNSLSLPFLIKHLAVSPVKINSDRRMLLAKRSSTFNLCALSRIANALMPTKVFCHIHQCTLVFFLISYAPCRYHHHKCLF